MLLEGEVTEVRRGGGGGAGAAAEEGIEVGAGKEADGVQAEVGQGKVREVEAEPRSNLRKGVEAGAE